jgi:xanthine dehydrogenase accessory factor
MNGMYSQVKQLLEEGETLAMATIVSSKGSTPREVGAKMVVTASGDILGTVGGGCGEAEVCRKAVEVIRSRKPAMVTVELMDDIESDSPAVCGGIMDVFVDPWWDDPDSAPCKEFARELARATVEGSGGVIATVLNAENCGGASSGQKCLIRNGGIKAGNIAHKALLERILTEAESQLNKEESKEISVDLPETQGKAGVFLEVIPPMRKAVIVGAGHLAIPLVQFAKILGFHVTVLDDRIKYANRERFPDVDEVLVGDMAETLRNIAVTPFTYIILITRGHQYDEPCLRAVIESPAKYIGMIGSKRRIKACFIRFRDEDGIAEELLNKVHAPIGLDIGSETPEEIALSIIAEIIKVRRGGTGQSLTNH